MVKYFIPVGVFAAILVALPWTLPADQDSTDSSATPSPSPAHHRHAHARHSPSPTPDESDEGADASVTPAANPRKHHHPTAADEPADAAESPSPSPAESDQSDVSAATPKPRKHHHPTAADEPADAAESPSPSPAESDQPDVSSATPKPRPSVGPDASLATDQLEEFDRQPANVQALIETSLALTRQNLTYTYSSADPANGGMDCSGFTYYVLTQAGVKDVPRDAVEQYEWVWKADNFRAVNSRNLDGFELDDLKPGDLLFWTGTYSTDRDPPVTHTMIYLGREKDTGDRVMVGSSDGRSYHGIQRWGVSVFDFKPAPAEGSSHSTTRFIGYGAIPGL